MIQIRSDRFVSDGVWQVDMDNKNILEKIEQSDMVLVGLGEEFDNISELRQNRKYVRGCEALKNAECQWMIPAWNEFCSEKSGSFAVIAVLEKLARLLADKNYFVVSVATAGAISRISWKNAGFVMPCGSTVKKQCSGDCVDVLPEVTDGDRILLQGIFEELFEGGFSESLTGRPTDSYPESLSGMKKFSLGECSRCGSPLVLNNIYAENYKEKGYLDQWKIYLKWLQGTLNRRLLILELGVGMKYPSVIRWPFEKAAFFNKTAFFCRVNGNLYQLAEELSGKGCGISQNAIDWLSQL